MTVCQEPAKRSRVNVVITIIGMIMLIVLAIWIGLIEARHLEFDPVNGHFQNFNAEFRLLLGQRPFVDFPAYLGLGPVLLPFPLFALLGGTLAASNFVYNSLSVLFLGVSVVLTLRLCKAPPAIAWSAAAFMAAVPWPFEHGNDSALGIRSFLPFIAGFLLVALARRRRKGAGEAGLHALAGCAAGIMPLWSNDYGLPTMSAFTFVFLVSSFPGIRRAPPCLATFGLSAAASFMIVVSLATGGHPLSWFTFNFGDVLRDQFWYYDPVAIGKVYSIADIPHDWPTVVGLLLPAAILSLVWLSRPRDSRMAALAAISVAAVGGAFVSGLGGTFQLRYFLPLWRLSLMTFPYCVVLCLAFLSRSKPRLRSRVGKLFCSDGVIHVASTYFLVGGAIVFFFFARGAFWHLPTPQDIWVPELGGSIPQSYLPAVDIGRVLKSRYDAKDLPADKRLLSTYATATALIAGSRQDVPDYLIHALGAAARARFVAALDGDYQNVETMDPHFMLWGTWNVRESWPFYRKLYSEWKPTMRTPWSLIWSRRGKAIPQGAALPCQVKRPGPHGFITLSVIGPPNKAGWLAEVDAHIKTSFTALPEPLVGSHRLLEVVEDYDGADRKIDFGKGLSQTAALVSNTWTLQIKDGLVEMPLKLRSTGPATLSLRAWPRARAKAAVTSCSAHLMFSPADTSYDEPPDLGGVIRLAPTIAPQEVQPFPARKATRALYLLTQDPLAPAEVRVGDKVILPGGQVEHVLLRDFREIVISWSRGGPLHEILKTITVVPQAHPISGGA